MKELTYISHLDDTIAAIATPLGQAGLGIVRISGSHAFEIADRVFQGNIVPSQAPSHTAHYGHMVDPRSGETIDEVMLTVLHRPRTYTAENSAEISCHGGALILQKVLELAIHSGARLAMPGEFTLRAFLNGRIDLAQAEAVADLISARSDSGLKAALRQLEGNLSEKIESLRSGLIDLLAEIEAGLDFPEQNLETEEKKEILCRVKKLSDTMQKLISTYQQGRILQEGLSVVIIGRPNVGKSSLLNLLLQKDRAIVTPLPGTTRDVISEYAGFDGILVRLSDTAGFRISGDTIELEGIKRAETEIKKGDLVLLVVDSSEKVSAEERALEKKLTGLEYLIVLNKIDLVDAQEISGLEKSFGGREIARVSCTEQTGLEELKSKIVRRVTDSSPGCEVVITSLRHKEALERANFSLLTAAESLEKNMSPEFAALDLKKSLDAVGEIIGKTYTEEILNRIFSSFCIGK